MYGENCSFKSDMIANKGIARITKCKSTCVEGCPYFVKQVMVLGVGV